MAEICYGKEASSSRVARRKRMEMRKVKFVSGVSNDNGFKRSRLSISPASFSRGDNDAVENCRYSDIKSEVSTSCSPLGSGGFVDTESFPKFGVASVCGRRREMEDAVAIHPSFLDDQTSNMDYFGVYDGHGCSHVCYFLCNYPNNHN